MTDWHARLSEAFARNRQLNPERERTWERIISRAFSGRLCRLLDAGCGSGRFIPLLRHIAPVIVGVDTDDFALRKCAKSGAKLVRADVHQLPFLDGAFNGTWGSMILEQSSCRTKLIAEMARVTENAGLIVIRFATPEDLLRTTWWSLFPELLSRYLNRAIPVAELKKSAEKLGLRHLSSFIVEEEVGSTDELRQHRDCVSDRAYSPLWEVSDSELESAIRRAACIDRFRISSTVSSFAKW